MNSWMEWAAPLVEGCRNVLQAGIGVLIQSTLLLALGLLAGKLLQRRGPVLQSLVYRMTLGAVVASMLLSVLLAGSFHLLWSVSLPPAPGSSVSLATSSTAPAAEAVPQRPVPPVHGTAPAATARTAAEAAAVVTHRPSAPAATVAEPCACLGLLYLLTTGIWGAGSVLLLGGLLFCQWWIGRLRQGAAPIRTGAAAAMLQRLCESLSVRPPELLASARVRSPFLTGLWRPAILLPSGCEAEFDGPALPAIFIHELTHLARQDCAWNLLARLACALVWCQPFLWVLARRLEHASEEVCDQAVLQQEDDPRTYADCLLRLAERFLPAWPERAAGIGVVPFRSSLGQRIEQILNGSRQTLSLAFRLRALTAIGAACAVALTVSLVSAAATRRDRGPMAAQAQKATAEQRLAEAMLALAQRRMAAPAQKTAAPQPAGGPVSGRVVTPDGKPVPGATVSWVSRRDGETLAQASLRTDAEGRFHFENTARFRYKDDFPELLVEAAGWGLTFQKIPEGEEPVETTLNLPTELRVTFVDQAGKPASGLAVVPMFLSSEQHSLLIIPQSFRDRLTRRTDPTGTVAFPELPQGYRVRLDAKDERFARLTYQDDIRLSQGPVSQAGPIHLLPGASIQGRITFGPSGKPAEGIKVGAQGIGLVEGWGDAVSGPDGAYRITQLGPGAYNVALDLKGEMANSWTARAHERVYVGQGEHLSGFAFALIHGAVITGKVAAEDNGEPVAGVPVGVYGPAHPQSGAWVQGHQTGPDGTYLHRVPAGKQHLYLMLAQGPSGFRLPANNARDLTVRDGESVTMDFKLPRGREIQPARGRVLGPDGNPIARAEVMIASLGRFAPPSAHVQTDATGAFTVEASLLSAPVSLRARSGDLATPAATTVSGGENVTLRLQKNALASLSGRVTDAAGKPFSGARVELTEWAYDTGHGTGTARSDGQGNYRFSGLWTDVRYSVQVSAEGHGQKWSETVQLQPGAQRTLPPLALQKADRFIAGRVVEAKGDPAAGVEVYLDGRETSQLHTVTDREGRFRFDGVVEEDVSLSAHTNEKQWARKKVKAGSADVVLVLPGE